MARQDRYRSAIWHAIRAKNSANHIGELTQFLDTSSYQDFAGFLNVNANRPLFGLVARTTGNGLYEAITVSTGRTDGPALSKGRINTLTSEAQEKVRQLLKEQLIREIRAKNTPDAINELELIITEAGSSNILTALKKQTGHPPTYILPHGEQMQAAETAASPAALEAAQQEALIGEVITKAVLLKIEHDPQSIDFLHELAAEGRTAEFRNLLTGPNHIISVSHGLEAQVTADMQAKIRKAAAMALAKQKIREKSLPHLLKILKERHAGALKVRLDQTSYLAGDSTQLAQVHRLCLPAGVPGLVAPNDRTYADRKKDIEIELVTQTIAKLLQTNNPTEKQVQEILAATTTAELKTALVKNGIKNTAGHDHQAVHQMLDRLQTDYGNAAALSAIKGVAAARLVTRYLRGKTNEQLLDLASKTNDGDFQTAIKAAPFEVTPVLATALGTDGRLAIQRRAIWMIVNDAVKGLGHADIGNLTGLNLNNPADFVAFRNALLDKLIVPPHSLDNTHNEVNNALKLLTKAHLEVIKQTCAQLKPNAISKLRSLPKSKLSKITTALGHHTDIANLKQSLRQTGLLTEAESNYFANDNANLQLIVSALTARQTELEAQNRNRSQGVLRLMNDLNTRNPDTKFGQQVEGFQNGFVNNLANANTKLVVKYAENNLFNEEYDEIVSQATGGATVEVVREFDKTTKRATHKTKPFEYKGQKDVEVTRASLPGDGGVKHEVNSAKLSMTDKIELFAQTLLAEYQKRNLALNLTLTGVEPDGMHDAVKKALEDKGFTVETAKSLKVSLTNSAGQLDPEESDTRLTY